MFVRRYGDAVSDLNLPTSFPEPEKTVTYFIVLFLYKVHDERIINSFVNYNTLVILPLFDS